jgi:hypothetical protein
MTPTPNNKPQTYAEQLFGPGLNKVLWCLLLVILVIGLIGTFWDLDQADILGTGQSLDAGSAGAMVVGALVIGFFFLAVQFFNKEARAKRGLAPFTFKRGN